MGDQKCFNARSDCNKHIIKREHYTRKKGKIKPKKPFNSEEDAWKWIRKYHMDDYKAYRCGVCGFYHVGLDSR